MWVQTKLRQHLTAWLYKRSQVCGSVSILAPCLGIEIQAMRLLDFPRWIKGGHRRKFDSSVRWWLLVYVLYTYKQARTKLFIVNSACIMHAMTVSKPQSSALLLPVLFSYLHAVASLSEKSFHIRCKSHLKVHIDHPQGWALAVFCLAVSKEPINHHWHVYTSYSSACKYILHISKQRDVRSRSNSAVLAPLQTGKYVMRAFWWWELPMFGAKS